MSDIQNGHISSFQPPLQLSSISSALWSWKTFNLNSFGLTFLPYCYVFYVISRLEKICLGHIYICYIYSYITEFFWGISENHLPTAHPPGYELYFLFPWHFSKRQESVSNKCNTRRQVEMEIRKSKQKIGKYVSWLKRNEAIKTERQNKKQNKSQSDLKQEPRVKD